MFGEVSLEAKPDNKEKIMESSVRGGEGYSNNNSRVEINFEIIFDRLSYNMLINTNMWVLYNKKELKKFSY